MQIANTQRITDQRRRKKRTFGGCWFVLPAVGGWRLAVVGCRLSVVGCRLSVVGCRLSVVGCRLSFSGWRLAAGGSCCLLPAPCSLPASKPASQQASKQQHNHASASSGWRLAFSGCRLSTCDLRLATCDLRLATCDLRLATCDLRLATCDTATRQHGNTATRQHHALHGNNTRYMRYTRLTCHFLRAGVPAVNPLRTGPQTRPSRLIFAPLYRPLPTSILG